MTAFGKRLADSGWQSACEVYHWVHLNWVVGQVVNLSQGQFAKLPYNLGNLANYPTIEVKHALTIR
jgi:hypothetical protein